MATNNLPDPIVTKPISNVIVNIDAPDTTIDLSNYFDDPLTTGKVARFNLANTSGGTIGNGTINVVLFNQTGIGAPLTVQNFQSYVTAGSYTNSFIHRSVPGFIVQGGGYTYNNSTLGQISANPAVQNEFSTNRSNLRGTIAMAKLGSDPNSATNQWFFNLADNSTNLNNQNGGFTVFGQAIATNDLTTIDAIANVPIYNAGTAFTNLPLTKSAISDTNFIRFSSITVTQEDELKFSIVGNSQPTLVTPKITNQQLVLDYLPNQTGNSDITIRATNLFGEFIDYKFTATVLPTITLSSSNIAENQPINTVIGNLITTNTGNTFTYSLVTGTGATDNTLFTITGNQLKANAAFDFETKNSYTVRVRTTDQGGLFFDKQLTIGVSNANEIPTNITLSNNAVTENQAIGTIVGNLTTTDPDTANTFTYSLVTGTGATDNTLFTITGNQLKANAAFDFETKNSYTVRVRTTDQGGLFFDKQLTIGVSNANEIPTNITLSNNAVTENQAIGTIVGNLTTTDPDTANTFTYSLVTGTGATDNTLFTITGNQLKANAAFDFETKNSYTVRVRTTDQGGLFSEKQFTININNLDNIITGTIANENFSTTGEKDTINAQGGNDTITSSFENLQPNDSLNGGTGNDTLIITGGTATDAISISVNNTNNQLNIVGTTIINFEQFDLSGFGGKTNFLGAATNDWIKAGIGNDILNGGAGADTMIGGAGNDSYYVDNVGDSIIENANQGTDTVFTTITYTLAANVENLTLQGTTAINGIGNDLNNTITGNTVANTLNGGAGADTLIGGVGNDNLSLGLNDNAIDNVNYVLGDGVDTVTQFIRGIGGDKLNFSGITNLDVKTSGTSTQIRVGDGIGGNAGFGTGLLLVTLSGTTGFVAGDVNVNLFGGNFSFT